MNVLALVALAALPPVVIIPGDGSNQLEARLDKKVVPHFYCSKKADWFRLWLNTADLLATTSCWADNIRLQVNTTSGLATNAPGVETRVPHFGSTEGFEELDPSVPGHATSAFRKMVQAFVDAGYERNSSLRGAPYDFRYTPDSTGFTEQLRLLVEETVAASAGLRVTLISHSMGGLQALYFLRVMPAAWKSKYIAQWIPISTPFAGAAKIARLHATGDNQGLPVPNAAVRDEQRSYETNLWLFPSADAASPWTDFPLVSTDDANFTVASSHAFFDAIGYSVGSLVLSRVASLLPARNVGPGVRVLCLYSTLVDTPLSFYYKGGDFSKSPVTTTGDGDGTVNTRSLRICEDWAATQSEAVEVQTFESIDHAGMISDEAVIRLVVNATRSQRLS